MKFHRSLLALAAFAAMSVPAFAPALPAEAPPETPEFKVIKEEVLTEMRSVIDRFAFVPGADFDVLEQRLASRQSALDEATDPSSFVRVVNNALQEFGFSHITLFSPVDTERRNTGRMVGIGIRIQLEDDGIRVMHVFPEAPAARGGLLPGDLIFEADGRPVRTSSDLAGEENSEVTIRYRRDGRELTATLKRERFSTVIPESIRWINPETALVTIPTFDTGYDRDNVTQVMKEAKDAKHIILDLRSNGGGAVINLMHLAGYFMPRTHNLGTFVDRRMYDGFRRAHEDIQNPTLTQIAEWSTTRLPFQVQTDANRVKGKVVVLIDGGTGSASEMLAASLRDQMQCKLIGSRSAGAVLASLIRPMKHGYAIQFPITDYVTPGGYRIEGNGLKPDIEADPIIRYNEPDRAIMAALAELGV